MRVAFVTNIVPPYRKTFYEKLCRSGAVEWLIVRGSTEHEDGRPDYRGSLAVPEARVTNKGFALGTYKIRWQRGALRAVRSFRPDVLIVLGIPGTLSNWVLCLWARAMGVKVVMWTCGWEAQRPGSLALRLKQRFAHLYFSMADVCLLYSSKGAAYLRDMRIKSRLHVCFNGIEIDHLLSAERVIRGEAAALRRREARSDQILLYVGAMLEEKRVDMLLRAYAQLGDAARGWQLWLVGDGPARADFERLAAELGLTGVRFWGRIVEEVDQFFAAADLFVLPGIGGLAFNQAMFWGIPCIAGAADGTEDDLVLDGVTGKRFEPGNLQSLVNAIRDGMRVDQSERARWAQRARSLIVTRSNVTTMVDTFVRTLADIDPAARSSALTLR